MHGGKVALNPRDSSATILQRPGGHEQRQNGRASLVVDMSGCHGQDGIARLEGKETLS